MGLSAPQCHLHNLAVGLPLGRHQGVSVHVHRGQYLGMPHQFLLHTDRRSCAVKPGTERVAERVPADGLYFPAASTTVKGKPSWPFEG